MLLSNNGLTHRSDFLSGNEVIVHILTNILGLLNIGKIYIPLTNRINMDMTVVEYSAPEGTVYVTGKNLGEHASLLGLVENALLLYNKAVIELNVLRLENYDLPYNRNERYNSPNEKSIPMLKRRNNTLSRYYMRSVYSHFESPFQLQ